MKYTGMDANRVIVSYRMTSVLWMPMLFILLGGPTLVLSEDTSGPSATIKILAEYTEQPREGDSVTLDCEISSIQLTDYVLWARRSNSHHGQIFIVNKNGLTSSTDNRFSVSSLQVINSTVALYSHNITIDPVLQSDQGFYQCFVNRNIMQPLVITQSAEINVLVYHPDEFPVCFPDGPATVTIGSSLSCKTLSDTRITTVSEMGMPNAPDLGWVTSPTDGGRSPGQELNKTVTYSEHGIAFHCFSLSADSAMAFSCNIGPLTVVSETTQSPDGLDTTVDTTMNNTTQQSTGLSGADIAGIVIGVILFIIIIAVHTLCCRCNPKRWLHAKSYHFGASKEPGSTVRTQPDTELGNSEPPTSNFGSKAPAENDNGTTTMHGSGTSDNLRPALTPDPSTSEQPEPNPEPPAIYAQVNKTVPEPDTKRTTEPKPPAVYAQVNKTTSGIDTEKPTEPKLPAVYAQVNKTTSGIDTEKQTEPKPPAVYAQVNKTVPEPDTSEPQDGANGSSMLKKIKKIKRFGRNRDGQVVRPPKPEPVVIYADLELQKTGVDEVRRPPSDDSKTVYAEIKH